MATFDRECEQCGEPFTSPRKQARFCSNTCRSRAHRGKPPALKVVQGAKAETPKASTPPATRVAGGTSKRGYVTLEDQVRESLSKANAMDTIAGAAAVRVAQQIDKGGDAGSAVVSLSKELSRLVTEAKVEAAPQNRDEADEILARVNEKLLTVVQ